MLPTHEPDLTTEPHLLDILEELSLREPLFHREEFGSTLEDFDAIMAPNFWEIGASGRRYSRAYVLKTLEERMTDGDYEDVWVTRDFHCRELAPDLYLLAYTLLQGVEAARITRRSTLWRRAVDGWKVVFHQGTIVEPEP